MKNFAGTKVTFFLDRVFVPDKGSDKSYNFLSSAVKMCLITGKGKTPNENAGGYEQKIIRVRSPFPPLPV
jgi:hypothetical protein